MKFIIILLLFLLVPFVSSETTFSDNPDDSLIMSNSLIEESAGGITGSATAEMGCRYAWNCTNWSECSLSGLQTRNCINIGTCADIYKAPKIEQNCDYGTLEISELEKRIAPREPIGNIHPTFILILGIILIIGFVIFYLKKDWFKKAIKKLFTLNIRKK